MRYIAVVLILIAACKMGKPVNCPPCPEAMAPAAPDTMAYHGLLLKNDSLNTIIVAQSMDIDSMAARIDTYAKHLLRANTRIERVRKYAKIVQNNKTQAKFLLGWVNRAIEE